MEGGTRAALTVKHSEAAKSLYSQEFLPLPLEKVRCHPFSYITLYHLFYLVERQKSCKNSLDILHHVANPFHHSSCHQPAAAKVLGASLHPIAGVPMACTTTSHDDYAGRHTEPRRPVAPQKSRFVRHDQQVTGLLDSDHSP